MKLAADVDLHSIAKQTEGLSGAEAALICREAGLKCLSFDSQIETVSDLDSLEITSAFIEEAVREVKARKASQGKQSDDKPVLF